MIERRRRLINRHADLASRYRVYLVPGGLEIDEGSFHEIRRRRVLFDEVALVTLHPHRRFGGFLALTFLALVFAAVSAAVFFAQGGEGAWPLWILTLLSLLAAFLSLAMPAQVITVYGKRSRGRLVFLHPAKARERFALICNQVREAQERLAAEIAARSEPPLEALTGPPPGP